MLKFLRKYNKIILVVGGCFLMVAFLLPTALTQGGGMQNPKVVRIGDHVVRAREYGSASAKVQLYENLNILSGFIDRKENPVQHWLMLLHAAREGGFVGGPTDGAEVLNTYLSPQDRDVIIQRIGADAAYEALAEWRGVVRMLSTYTGAGRLSEAEAQLLALELFDEAQVNVAVLRPEVVEGVSEPTEEEILAHFEKYKDVVRGQGEFGFGYRLNAAIQLRWIAVERLRLAGAVQPDPIEVRKRWQGDRTRYPGEFDAERGNVERAIRDEQVEILMREADQIIQAAAVEEERKFPLRGRSHQLPEDWRSQVRDLELIAFEVGEAVERRTGTLLAPAVQRRDVWLDTPGLSNQTIGRTQFAIGARLVPFPLIIPEVQEIGGETARGPQVGLLNRRAARDPVGNMYYFRIMAARPEGPPRSVDEVRETVVQDLKRLRAYESLKAQADALRRRALAEGVRAIADDLRAEMVGGVVTERMVASLPRELDVPEFRRAVAEAARRLDPTRSIADAPLSDRLLVIPVDGSMTVALVEIEGRRPLTREAFRDNVALIEQVAAREAVQGVSDWPYTFDALKARYGVTEFGVREEAPSGGGAGSTQDQPAS
ncbi:MAG: hypothetical protein IBJ10_08085 [Phycisphaerales bacterium]|nr:hypothetical protein [Phycisphaerales bacterium]